MPDYRLTEAQHAALLADLDDLASRAGGILSRATRPRTLLRELEPWVEPEPEPEPPASLLGASSHPGGFSASTVQGVLDRYGTGIAVRLFEDDDLSNVAPVHTGAGRILASWKPSLGAPIDRNQALTAVAPLPPGSKVCVWHEPDVKARKGQAVAPMIEAHRQFAAIIRAERPDLDLMGVLSGWTFWPTENFRPEDYIDPAWFDVLALDLDGIKTSYPDFTGAVDEALAWMASVGIKRWTVAEFAAPRQASDPDGSVRARWMTEQVAMLRGRALPPEEIALFESRYFAGTELNALEQAAWRSLIAS